jgi:hypothetical protein
MEVDGGRLWMMMMNMSSRDQKSTEGLLDSGGMV